MILAKTVKGWTLGPGVEARNITHQAKKLSEAELQDLPRPARAADPGRQAQGRAVLPPGPGLRGGPVPPRAAARRSAARCRGASSGQAPLPKPPADDRRRVRGRLRHGGLDDDGLHPDAAEPDPRQGARAADRADHPGRGADVRHGPALQGGRDLRRRSASATSRSTRTSSCRTARRSTARSSRRASPRPARWRRSRPPRTSYATHGFPMIPFYIFYSMFGFQRTGDQIWALADARGRGFLMGATAGRTTLTGEGLQHDDGHSHVLASTDPERPGLRPGLRLRAGRDRPRRHRADVPPRARTSSTTSRSTTRTTPSRRSPTGIDEGIIRGIYRFAEAPDLGPKAAPRPASSARARSCSR